MRNEKEVSVKKWGEGARRIGVTEGEKSMLRAHWGNGQISEVCGQRKGTHNLRATPCGCGRHDICQLGPPFQERTCHSASRSVISCQVSVEGHGDDFANESPLGQYPEHGGSQLPPL